MSTDYENKAEKYEMNHFCDKIEEEPEIELYDSGYIGDNRYELKVLTIGGYDYNQLFINDEQFNDDFDTLEDVENLIEDLQNYERITKWLKKSVETRQ